MAQPGFLHQFIHGQGHGAQGPRRAKPSTDLNIPIIGGCVVPLVIALAAPFLFFIGFCIVLAIVANFGAAQNCDRGDDIIAALSAYRAEHGRYPDSLATLVTDGKIALLPKAALGGRWIYHNEGKSFTLVAGSLLIYDNVQFVQPGANIISDGNTLDSDQLRRATDEVVACIYSYKAANGELPKRLEDAIKASSAPSLEEEDADYQWEYVPHKATDYESEWFVLRGWKVDDPGLKLSYEGGRWISIAD